MSDHQHEIDDLLDGTAYSGTFRWKLSKSLPNMPPISRLSSLLEPFQVDLDHGWRGYFFSRGQYSSFPGAIDDSVDAGDYLVGYALKNLCLVDCMSFPLSIAYILSRCNMFDGGKVLGKYRVINILCTGCSQRAEERILRQTNAFDELIFLLPGFHQINLWLIGPEISETKSSFREFSYNSRRITSNLFQGNMGQFFRQNSSFLAGNSVVFGFNCGFGNFENPMPKKFDLLLSWISDLFFLTGTQLPLFFTCANHYADVSGEISVMHNILGAILTLLPCENPFSFASTLIPPEDEWRKNGGQPTEFSRGNSYFYGAQHCDKSRRKKINVNVEDKSRILGSIITHITQAIDLKELTKSLLPATLHFERSVSPSPRVTTSKSAASANTFATCVPLNEHQKLDSSDNTEKLLLNTVVEEEKRNDMSHQGPRALEGQEYCGRSSPPQHTKHDECSNVVGMDGLSPSVRNDFFANVNDKKCGSSHSGPSSTRSGYSSKSSSPGTGLRNESKLLATIQAAKSNSPSNTKTNEALNLSSTPLEKVKEVQSILDERAVIPPPSKATLAASVEPSAPEEGLSTISMEDSSLVNIEQNLLPESKQLQILISSPLPPPHQLKVNTLALNLHTSGNRLRISTPTVTSNSGSDQSLYYSREIVLFYKVKCSPKDLEAKYSKKKNLLTVKIALSEDSDLIA